MYFIALLALVAFASGQDFMLDFDCDKYPSPCNNDCYATYVAELPHILNWMNDGKSSVRRSAAGCVSPNPCGNGKMKKPSSSEGSCDEYPYASTTEGGKGAMLRCTNLEQNTDEGRVLNTLFSSKCRNNPCAFELSFGNPNNGKSPYCEDDSSTKNDGYQYTYKGSGTGKYDLYGRDAIEDGGWVPHKPDPSRFHASHLRRELLLADGRRTMLATRNTTKSYDDAIFVRALPNGTIVETADGRELFGSEKSWGLQDPTLRKAKRAVDFAS